MITKIIIILVIFTCVKVKGPINLYKGPYEYKFSREMNETLVTLRIKLTFNMASILEEQNTNKKAHRKTFLRHFFIHSFHFGKMHIIVSQTAKLHFR